MTEETASSDARAGPASSDGGNIPVQGISPFFFFVFIFIYSQRNSFSCPRWYDYVRVCAGSDPSFQQVCVQCWLVDLVFREDHRLILRGVDDLLEVLCSSSSPSPRRAGILRCRTFPATSSTLWVPFPRRNSQAALTLTPKLWAFPMVRITLGLGLDRLIPPR